MRIRVTASSGVVRCEESVRPCFAHAVWGAHGIYRNMEMGHGKGKKKKRKTHNLHRARAKPRGDEEQSGRGRVTGDTRPQSINLDYRPKDCVADDASDAYALFSPSSYF